MKQVSTDMKRGQDRFVRIDCRRICKMVLPWNNLQDVRNQGKEVTLLYKEKKGYGILTTRPNAFHIDTTAVVSPCTTWKKAYGILID